MVVVGAAGIISLVWCWKTLQRPVNNGAGNSEADDQAAFMRNYYSARNEMRSLPSVDSQGQDIKPASEIEEQYMTYQIVSQLWKQHVTKQIHYAEIARFWRDVDVEERKPRVVDFKNIEIARFYDQYILNKPFFTGLPLSAIQDILEVLDLEGNVPSVVNLNPDEPEKKHIDDQSTYDKLHNVPLYRHSLNTAEEIIAKIEKGSPAGPKAVIAALAHDLGKLPSRYGQFYKSATHNLASVAVIESMHGIKNLSYFDDISEAIRNHHIQSEKQLDNQLREADQAARRKELVELDTAARQAAENPVENEQPFTAPPAPEETAAEVELSAEATSQESPAPPAESAKEAAPVSAPEDAATEEKREAAPAPAPAAVMTADDADILGAKTGKNDRQRSRRQLVDITPWFNEERLLSGVADVVNTRGKGEKFWSAISLDGYVYVKPTTMWDVIGSSAGWPAELRSAALFEQKKDDIVYSVVSELRKTQGIIATEFVQEGFSGAVFMHESTRDGAKPVQMYLIPFRIEALGDRLADAERHKDGPMRMTKALVPKQRWKGTQS